MPSFYREWDDELAAHAMVNAIWASPKPRFDIFLPTPDRRGAGMMAAFYHELNEQQGWGAE
jgi:hypothetical protein